MKSNLKWKISLYALAAVFVLLAVLFVTELTFDNTNEKKAIIFSLIVGFLIAVIVHCIIQLVALFKDDDEADQDIYTLDDVGSLICNQESKMARVFNDCEKMMTEKKAYLIKGLKINDFATMVGTNRTYVSRTLNKFEMRGYCHYVNSYRVKEAKITIQENPDLRVDEVASRCGFTSPGTFCEVFKDFEKMSPREYIQTIRDKRDFGL